MADPNIPDAVGFPIGAAVNTSTHVASGSALQGGTFYQFRDITFNRVIVEGTSVTSAPTICLACYQFASGVMNDGTSLVPQKFLIQNRAVTNTVQTLTLAGDVTLVQGFYYMLIGRDGGTSWTFRGHTAAANATWHGPGLVAPAFPLVFSTATPATPPATLNLATVTTQVSNHSIVHRLLKV